MKKFRIEFYEKENGESEVWNFLESLRQSSNFNKASRIQYRQMMLYIQLLQDNGINLPSAIAKHLDENIWELRPGNNRVLYFFFQKDTFVLLHHFRKKTNKTLAAKLKRQKENVMIISGGQENENMG